MKTDRSAEFVRNMTVGEAAEPAPAITARPNRSGPEEKKTQQPASRAGLKHFGGYLDDATLEKIALLRVRLKKDNSELIKFAIDELYAKNHAKRAFGDA
jgi:hypothetical protein